MAVSRDRLMAYSIVFNVHPEAYSSLSIYMKPNVHQIEAAGSIGRGQSDIYTSFMVSNLDEQRRRIAEDPIPIYRTLFSLLDCTSDDEIFAQSLLATIDGIIQDDSRQVLSLIQLATGRETFNVINLLVRFASTYKTIPIIVGAASHILSTILGELILRNRENPGDYVTQASRLVDSLINQGMESTLPLEEATYCFLPLFKIDAVRREFLRTGGLRTILVPLLDQKSGIHQPIYAAICCLWMISFDEDSYEFFIRSDYNLIGKIIKELRRTDKEKVIRVALGILKNLSAGEGTVEIMIENKLVEIIDNLSKRILKDPDVTELVKDLGDILVSNVKLFSSFDKWLKEVERGDLVPGVTHTEAFWKENAKHLENDSFGPVKKLVQLLNSESVQTVALALADIGEFARFHPYGKTVASKLGAKIKAMELMQNPNKDVNGAALLCIQKIMIQNWQSIS
ncbi:unnamed protein product [Blepharisma stoltei]|uniref:V-type proton ATPase subunit H n=1 Tax=Blepharisma stoltei TaxID=1481888 RepID=A0AAU9I6I7_9CILI|nr:unnamed protein product [Blepharisma stoltei]